MGWPSTWSTRAGVRSSVENPWAYLESNVTGTLNMLELCRVTGTRKFLLASTKAMKEIARARFEAFGCAGNASRIKPVGLADMAKRYESGALDPNIA